MWKAESSAAGEALFDLIIETTSTFFRIREVGGRYGAAGSWGGSALTIMRALRSDGPLSVPDLARRQPVARQHIQKVAKDLAEQGLIVFVDNPRQRRSKLLRLTTEGERAFDTMYDRLLSLTEEAAKELDPTFLRATADGLKTVRERLERI